MKKEHWQFVEDLHIATEIKKSFNKNPPKAIPAGGFYNFSNGEYSVEQEEYFSEAEEATIISYHVYKHHKFLFINWKTEVKWEEAYSEAIYEFLVSRMGTNNA